MSYYKPVTMCTAVVMFVYFALILTGPLHCLGLSYSGLKNGVRSIVTPYLSVSAADGACVTLILVLVEVGFYQVLACYLSSGRGPGVPCIFCVLITIGRLSCHNFQSDFVVLWLYHTDPSERSLHIGLRAYWYDGVIV